MFVKLQRFMNIPCIEEIYYLKQEKYIKSKSKNNVKRLVVECNLQNYSQLEACNNFKL